MSSRVVTQVYDGIAHLHLARPDKRNAIDHAMAADFRDAIEAFACEGIRVAVLSADGPIFCAGADLDEVRHAPHDPASERLLETLRASELVWVAAVAHPALGAGVSLVSACHVVVASEDVWFSLPEWQVGLFPAAVINDLEPVLGSRRALAMGLSGERLSAAEASTAGLVNEVVPAEKLDASVAAWTRMLAGRESLLGFADSYWKQRLDTDHHAQRAALLRRLMEAQYR